MSLKDRFRIDELKIKGSKAIPRDKSGRIVVRKTNGLELPPNFSMGDREKQQYFHRKKSGKPIPIKWRQKRKEKPFGLEPIKKKTISPRTKEDLTVQPYIPTQEELKGYPNQESFGGETSGRIERPVYDEQELQKAKDLKVDELIKPRKQSNGKFVKIERLNASETRLRNEQEISTDLRQQLNQANSQIGVLEGNVNSLGGQIESLNDEIVQKDTEISDLFARYEKLLEDYQSSVIKGTKEGIERVSLTAQVQGLQAQKETLQAQMDAQSQQLQAQQDIVKSLQSQQEIQQQVQEQQVKAKEKEIEETKKGNLLDIVGDRPQYQVKGKVAWAAAASNKNIKPQWPVYWDDRRKGPKGVLSGMKFDFFNIGEEDVILNVTEEVLKKGKWLTGVPSTIRIPKSPDNGSSPGQKTVTFGRGSTGKGTYETMITFKNTTTKEELKMKTHYWQARRRRKT